MVSELHDPVLSPPAIIRTTMWSPAAIVGLSILLLLKLGVEIYDHV